ncbi:MAG TPA: ABC transporter permease [Puia sp.]|nr:ABC transporter permease [Puia sp.]
MIKNYFTTAWRNIRRHLTYSLINVFGLALGICTCIVVFLIAHYEYSTDAFHPGGNRIYRVVETLAIPGFHNAQVRASAPLDLPQRAGGKLTGVQTLASYVLYAAKIAVPGGDDPGRMSRNQIAGTRLPSTIIAGPEYFRIFSYDWLAGSPATALAAPNTVVLTTAAVRKYFGNASPEQAIGRTIVFNDSLQAKVTGIIKDWTQPTDNPFTEFISRSSTHQPNEEELQNGNRPVMSPSQSRAWLELAPGASPARVNAQLHAIAGLRAEPPGFQYNLKLQPLADIHFDATVTDGQQKAHLPTLYALMGIAGFILLLAAINFINLSIALAVRRSKEIGVRKVMGGSRRSITLQFLTETFVLTVAALGVAAVAVRPVLGAFRSLISDGVTAHVFDPANGIFILLLVVGATLLAGLYPARVLSGFVPVLCLKGPLGRHGGRGLNIRKALIVFQFSISLIFIISTVIVSRQIDYMRTTDIGFKTDAILTLPAGPEDSTAKPALFAERLRHLAGIVGVTQQSFAPISDFTVSMEGGFKGRNEQPVQPGLQTADSNFIPLYGIRLLAGRNLTEGGYRDSIRELVINESMAKAAGFKTPEEAVGQPLFVGTQSYPIVGVVADYHEHSYRAPIKPVVIFDVAPSERSIGIKLASKNKSIPAVKNTLARIAKTWKQLYPGTPFTYSFLDESIAALYAKEEKTETLINVTAAISIFISCMGLFGLSLFSAGQRSKEISIRKVLGASVIRVATLLTRDIVLLIGLSLVIAAPVAWYFTHRWLQDYQYRASVGAWVFLVPGVVVLLLGILTVSVQTIRAATANPVTNLRAE